MWLSKAIDAALKEERGLAVGKLGTCEAETLYINSLGVPYSWPLRRAMTRNAGLWPDSNTTLQAWTRHMKRWLPTLDAGVVWYSREEEQAWKAFAPRVPLHKGLEWLSPWKHPWTLQIPSTVTVAVVSPFAYSIRLQIPHLNSLFAEPLWQTPPPPIVAIRSGCSPALDTASAAAWSPQQLAVGWQQVVEEIVREVLETGARVALVGCGALSLPIVCSLKSHGIIAIHLGGATQILFGIRGKRWETDADLPFSSPLWRDPLPSETPQNARTIEGGCYWMPS